jgi:hypothetical protein
MQQQVSSCYYAYKPAVGCLQFEYAYNTGGRMRKDETNKQKLKKAGDGGKTKTLKQSY